MPDFRNIEDEVESIDFSYVERRYADRRPFFVEGGGYMPPSEMFYSRRIPDFDLGVKTFGTIDRTTIGLLDAWTFGGRNDVALGVLQQADRDTDVALGYVRSDRPAGANETYHTRVDYRHTRGGLYSHAQGRLFESRTKEGKRGKAWDVWLSQDGRPRRPALWVKYERLDPTFDPWNGFAPDTDLEGVAGGILTGKYGPSGTVGHGLALNFASFDRTDGRRYHDDIGLSYWTRYGDGTSWSLGSDYSERPPHVDRTWRVSLGWNETSLHQVGSVSLTQGKLGGADYRYYGVSQGYAVSDRVRLRLGHESRESDYPGDGADEHLQRTSFTFNYDLTPEKTVGGRLLTGTLGTNFYMSYRQAVRRGTDFFVILGDPNTDNTEERLAAKMKWVYQ